MKLLIILTFCLGFVVCRSTVMYNYPPSAPLESGSPHRAPLESTSPHGLVIHSLGPEVPVAADNSTKVFYLTRKNQKLI